MIDIDRLSDGNAREVIATIEQTSEKSSQRIDSFAPRRFGFAENRAANRVDACGRVIGGRSRFPDRDDA